jgi:capsular exopolysaccharide synthesis family protein
MEDKQTLTENEDFETIDFKRLFALLRRNLLILIVALLFSAGAAYFVSLYLTPVYSASTQAMVTSSSKGGNGVDITQSLNSQQVALTYVELLQQEWMLDKVAERVGVELNEDQISVSLAASNTPLIQIEVEDPDPNLAVQIANTLVRVLIEQNETVQAGRYISAEAAQNLRIQNMEDLIARTADEYEQANKDAFQKRVLEMEEEIRKTLKGYNDANETDLPKLQSIVSSDGAKAMIVQKQIELDLAKLKLEKQMAQYKELENDLANNPLVQTDPKYAPDVQAKMAQLGLEINQTNEDIADVLKEIEFLTPLTKDKYAVALAIKEKIEYRDAQKKKLDDLQKAYIELTVAGQLEKDPIEVTTLKDDLTRYQEIYRDLLNNREALRLERLQNMPNVVQPNPAIPTDKPIRPRMLLNTFLGGLAGLILALSAVLLRDFLDTTIKSREDVERALGLPVLGYVLPMPSSKDSEGPFVTHSPRSPAAEAFRSLRTSLEFIGGADKPVKSVLISSSGAGEGKTITACNLALIMAQGGKRVVIMDADLRRPRLHQELGVPNRVGLSDLFRGKVVLDEVVQRYGETNLSVITSGGIPPNPAELLGSEKMMHILDELTSKFDSVIVDSTPTLVTDTQLIAARVDGVLIVVRAGETQSDATRNTVDQYRRVGARLLGVVLNNVTAVSSGYGYSAYANYNHYHYDENRVPAGKGWSLSFRTPWKKKKVNAEKTEE